tara:strand:- start:1283 stop:3058 length:1776 start_codon:yes stop_codon:yes gene_type:complete
MKQKIILFYVTFLLVFINQANAQKIPVTDKQFNNSDAVFRFAIVSDRTGGMQPGIFKQAIDKIALMQPELVLSVGDLIDGYTEDPKIWNAQWDEFDAIVDKLEMPFYHVPGNHDTSNKLLTEAWRSRLGRDYYHFKYKDVLFLALNTDEIEGGGIGPEQIAYIEKILKENTDTKWTLLFMHRPLWSYGDRQGYDAIEKALGNRAYTVFSGHHHHYRYKMHNGMEHFTLATSGGGSNLRGADVGEFHHITWVTMKDNGPQVAHLELSGIYDKNVVNESDYADIQVLRKGDWLNVLPYVHSEENFDRIPVKLVLNNTSEITFVIKGELNETPNVSFYPKTIVDTLLPNTKKETLVNIISKTGKTPIKLLNDNPVKFEMQAGFSSVNGDKISLKTSKPLLVDWIHKTAIVNKPKIIDGDLTDWSISDFISVSQPQYFLEDWDWKNSEDGRFQFSVVKDNTTLYLAVQFSDDNTILENDILKRQDKFYVHIEAQDKHFEIELAASNNVTKPYIRWVNDSSIKLNAAVTRTTSGQVLEMAIPFKALFNRKKSDFIRLNLGVMDHDRPENTKPSVLWWRPLWGSDTDYKESGVFKLE